MNNIIRTLALIGIVLLMGCSDQDSDSLSGTYLQFDETAVNVTSSEQAVNLTVEWSQTPWEITTATDGFITGIDQSSGGNKTDIDQTTQVRITLQTNNSEETRSQEIVLKNLATNEEQNLTISQFANIRPALTVNYQEEFQEISGFGGADPIFGTDYLSDEEINLAIDKENGLGLSIIRVRLSSTRADWAGIVDLVKKANENQVKVIASAWSPPAAFKSNNSINGGGYLLEEYYDDYVAYINEFITFMTDNGAKIDVVSIQNEPDYQVSYEGCEYTIEEMYNFVKNFAGGIEGAKVLAAESLNFKHSYTDPILNDPEAEANVDLIGGHLYGSGGLKPYPLAEEKNKEIWMTEHLLNLNSGVNSANWTESTSRAVIWEETMDMAEEIQSTMEANWNAYIWWYIRRYYSFLGDGTLGTQRGTILKRGYVMSQFSKFVRPGYKRIATTFSNELDGFSATTYTGDDKTVMVFINRSDFDVSGISINGLKPVSSAKSYTTTLFDDQMEKELNHEDSSVQFSAPANSILTVFIEH